MSEGPRHLLVVAPQCSSMHKLTRLGEAASSLYDALAHPDLGGCAPGLPGRGSLIVGDGLSSTEIRELIVEAIEYAEDRRATLLLALLGHGFVPGSTNTLYLMGDDSSEEATERGSTWANSSRLPRTSPAFPV